MHGYNENTIKMDDLGGTPILGTPYLVQGSGILNGMFNTDEDFPKRTPFFLHGELYKKSPFVGDFSQPKSRSDILASKPVQVSHHDWESVTLAVLSDAWLGQGSTGAFPTQRMSSKEATEGRGQD